MKILLTGGTGQVGWELNKRLPELGQVIAPDRSELDLTRPDTVVPYVEGIRPDLIVNAAGFTAVDRAEEEVELADLINAQSPGRLAQAAAQVDAGMVHYSTDYVFNGRSKRPYHPTDATDPLNVYGASKRRGEEAVIAAGNRVLILRTSWVYSNRRSNFLMTMLAKAATETELRIVDDQHGSPTSASVIADFTTRLLAQETAGVNPPLASNGGIHHLVCNGQTTWYGFARTLLEQAGVEPLPSLVPIGTDQFKTAASRPQYSVLSNDTFQQAFKLTLPSWEQALSDVLATCHTMKGASS